MQTRCHARLKTGSDKRPKFEIGEAVCRDWFLTFVFGFVIMILVVDVVLI